MEDLSKYSIYVVFGEDHDKYGSRVKVYAGRANSRDKAEELARNLLKERGSAVEAVEVIDWDRPGDAVICRVERDDGRTTP